MTQRVSPWKPGWGRSWLIVTAVVFSCLPCCGGTASIDEPTVAVDAGDGGDAQRKDVDAPEADAQMSPRAEAPSFSIPGGTYHGAHTIEISVPLAGATIHYTVDGKPPNDGSPVYAEPIVLMPTTTTILQAFATAPGFEDSATTTATYEVLAPPQADAPSFAPPGGAYAVSQSITLSSPTPGAMIHYTLDGNAPTASSPVYVSPLSFDLTAMTIRAFVTAPDFSDSPIETATYTYLAPASVPIFSLPTGTYCNTQTVEIYSPTPDARIYYTDDGADPTVLSTEYAAALSIVQTSTLRAFAVAPGYSDSGIAEAVYTFAGPCNSAAPTFDPPGGVYHAPQSVVIASTTAGVAIYYTTDGNDPTATSELYVQPVEVSESLVLKAFAMGPYDPPSQVATAVYTVDSP